MRPGCLNVVLPDWVICFRRFKAVLKRREPIAKCRSVTSQKNVNASNKFSLNLGFGVGINIRLVQRFSNWIPRNLCIPERVVRGSDRRKYVLAEEFYWQS
jgi:hypothetical protein